MDRLAYGGDGVTHPGGFTVFVPRTAPGDLVRLQITDVRKRYGRGLALEVLRPSAHRIESKCPHFDRCGGCHYQHLPSNFAAEQKVDHIRDALERIGPGRLDVRPILSPKKLWNYRNRVTYHRSARGSQGYISFRNRREVLDIDSCPIAQDELNDLWRSVRHALEDFSADKLPYVTLRRATTGACAVILSTTVDSSDSDLAKRLSTIPNIRSLYVTRIKAGSYSPFGDEMILVHGKEGITEEIGDVQYLVRPDLFFQIHSEITEQLVAHAIEWAGERAIDSILDVYCGAGLFTLALARKGVRTLGVEIAHHSIRSAQTSAQANDLSDRARFRAGRADTILLRLHREGERFPAAIVDPPRKGLHPNLIASFPSLGIRNLLYVSCSPATMARDLKVLLQSGFQVRWIQPFDMFPQTYHVEILTALEAR